MSETPGQVLHLMIERHALNNGDDTARIDWATADDAEREAWEAVAAAFLAEIPLAILVDAIEDRGNYEVVDADTTVCATKDSAK